MIARNLAAGMLSVALLGGVAYAQTAPAPRANTATTTTTTAQKMDLKGNWRASKLMGLDVYNETNEKLGDVNEIILDKTGKVAAVVIGVGGFLGMGEHDVAVSMDKLKFMETAVRTSASATDRTTGAATSTTTAPATGTAATTTAPATTTTTAPATTTTTTTTTARADVNDWTPNHAVMNATKDQLKALPQFKYSDYN